MFKVPIYLDYKDNNVLIKGKKIHFIVNKKSTIPNFP